MKYKITFYTNWHCGSGLSSGADCDSLVVKDKNGLPFVPGKTIKGLLREAATEVVKFKQINNGDDKLIKIFGLPYNSDDGDTINQGETYFSNAKLLEDEENILKNTELKKYLYDSHAFTKIGKDGIAADTSLRRMESVVPCVLIGEILNIPDKECEDILIDALKYTKRLGLDRNRGFGRCDFQPIN